MEMLLELIKKWMVNLGMDAHLANNIETTLRVGLVIIFTLMLWTFLRLILLFIKHRLLNHLEMSHNGSLYILSILKQAISIIALIFTLQVLPEAFTQKSAILSWSLKGIIIAIIFFSTGILNCFLKILYDIVSKKDRYKQRPIKGFMQILQIAIYFIATILTVAAIIEKSPLGLLTGLGAFAAVVSFIFKDTLLGFVSGIQLSSNDMVRIGDWIVVPGTLANGNVIDISLITVKVQNFDNTIVTVPSYSLVSSSFQNWRGMDESGGRRMTININIDMDYVHFCTPDELQKLGSLVQLPADISQITNLELYRIYMATYIHKHKGINNTILTMVRHMDPTATGLPVQIYCFSAHKGWAVYEGVKSQITEHAIAMARTFGLKIFNWTEE